jgi:anti-anti-sigma regulatory factor
MVDKIARLALEARRHGRELVLLDVTPALRELIELCGLVVEMRR